MPIADVTLAASGHECLANAASGKFAVILIDVDLPDMDCKTLLKTLMLAQPGLRLIVTIDPELVTGATADELRQFDTVTVIPRPTPRSSVRFLEAIRELLERLGYGSSLKQAVTNRIAPARQVQRLPRRSLTENTQPTDFWITAIAVSTGGPSALTEMVPKLPGDYPHPILVVQHMPPIFTTSLARDLNNRSAVTVVEASDGDILKAGTVYIAPGGLHMGVKQHGPSMLISLNDDTPENSCRPSADVMYRSLAKLEASGHVLAVVMTGMGTDGCEGVRLIKRGACYCVSQSADSCAIYGMPRAVDEAGLADESVDLRDLHRRLAELAHGRSVVLA
jgi:two-component system, chemotaxis family, protein-glutamate methylesterase/glutaminase